MTSDLSDNQLMKRITAGNEELRWLEANRDFLEANYPGKWLGHRWGRTHCCRRFGEGRLE
jgi:hypothetical protein